MFSRVVTISFAASLLLQSMMTVSVATAQDESAVFFSEEVAEMKRLFEYTSDKATAQQDLLCPGKLDLLKLPSLKGFELQSTSTFPHAGRGLTQVVFLIRSDGESLLVKLFVASGSASQAHEMLLLSYSVMADPGTFRVSTAGELGDLILARGGALSSQRQDMLGFARSNVAVMIQVNGTTDAFPIARDIDRYLQHECNCKEIMQDTRVPRLLSLPEIETISVGHKMRYQLLFDRAISEPWKVTSGYSGAPHTARVHVLSTGELTIEGEGRGDGTIGICIYNEETLFSEWRFIDVVVKGEESEWLKNLKEKGLPGPGS